MKIMLNGEEREAPVQTVQQLLGWLGCPGSGVAVALNGQVVCAGEQAAAELSPGDEIEIIHAVQGG